MKKGMYFGTIALCITSVAFIVISCSKENKLDDPTTSDSSGLSTIIEADVTHLGTLKVNKENINGISGDEGSSKLVDGDTTTKFYVDSIPKDFYLQISFDTAKLIGAYTLTTANDFDSRDPRNWSITASNDEKEWITLDSQMGELFHKRRLSKRYDFLNNKKYKYYRLNISEIYNDVNFQLSEFRLLQVPEAQQKKSPVTYIDSITKDGLSLYFINKTGATSLQYQDKMIQTFFTNFPKLLQDFNPNALKKLNFIIDPNYDGVAYTFGSVIAYSADYMNKNNKDIDVVTHEIMHVIQAYPGGSAPTWLSEGIADYVRDKYGLDNAGAGWALPNYASNQKYTDSYRVTARFLKWIEIHVKDGFVKDVDLAIRTKLYNEDFWKLKTGSTLENLWKQYASNPNL